MRYAIPGNNTDSGNPSFYADHKRHWWLFSLFVPLLTVIGPVMYMIEANTWFLVIPFVIFYGAVPLIDMIIGEDESNPPEVVVPQLEADDYYRYTTYALVPVLIGAFIFTAWFVGSHSLTWFEIILTSLSCALICGFGLNLGHEMGHKKNSLDRWLAKIILSLGAYGHFNIEHNRGHHKEVATEDDSASSKMGETIYIFMLREMPGGFFRAWNLEKNRLEKKGLSCWSLKNEIIQPGLMTLVFYSALFIAFGAVMIPFLFIVMFYGAFQLTSANYVEHYGLLRKKLDNEHYERCQPHHSWNSNHKVSNWILFHLQRHSDHHANSARRFQSLRHFENAPQLPNGYFGMFVMAYIPVLWRRIMDPRVVEWAKGDLTRVNMYGPKKAALMQQYHCEPELEVA